MDPTTDRRIHHGGSSASTAYGWVASPDADATIVTAVTIGGALTCVSELRRRGLFAPTETRPHVAVARNASRLRTIEGVDPVLHWGGEITPRAAGCTTDPLDNVLVHAMDCLPTDWAVAALDAAARVDKSLSTARLEQLAIRAHSPRMMSALAFFDPRAESGLESLLRVRLAGAGILLEPQVVIGRFRVDGLIGERLIVEAAGYEFHSARPDFERDHYRASQLQLMGYTILQFIYHQIVDDWPRVLETIQAHIARRDHLWAFDPARSLS